jgi:hypothetical protein
MGQLRHHVEWRREWVYDQREGQRRAMRAGHAERVAEERRGARKSYEEEVKEPV